MKRTTWVVLCCAAGIAALYRIFVTTLPGQEVDQALMTHLPGLSAGALTPAAVTAAAWMAGAIAPLVGLVALVLVGMAIGRRQFRRYGSALLTIVGAMVTSELLKLVLSRPAIDELPMGNSFPSGHLTAVASVVVALVVLAPLRARAPLAKAGAVLVLAAGWSVVVLQWHRPSDVAAAILVAVGWGAIGSTIASSPGRHVRHVEASVPLLPSRPRMAMR
ncbi:PAP2 superfamily protein [Raineyella antarctica]|uniref:PAP2 superfamily protein n=1 Tax=Raineyella antarctica TaxID=1577474 RepID=A0A1G6HHW3_9ACTN|nr:phosphatase PAP2 family protein [Raineyella antarctica]SDB93535.1 PAP2 superfamily protein [Raineyella antarctica]